MYKIFTITLAAIALISLNSNARAHGGLPTVMHVESRPGDLPLVSIHNQGRLVPRDDSEDAGLIKIANTFTQYRSSPYWGWTADAVCGPEAGCAEQTQQWLATAFTPEANRLATRVEVPALYYGGTGGVVLSIYDDAGGVPGKALHGWHIAKLPTTACCTVVSGSYNHGISLTKGQQYWIVLSTDAKDPTSITLWGLTEYADVQKHGSTFADYCSGTGCSQLGLKDNGWYVFSTSLYGLAYEVLGK